MALAPSKGRGQLLVALRPEDIRIQRSKWTLIRNVHLASMALTYATVQTAIGVRLPAGLLPYGTDLGFE